MSFLPPGVIATFAHAATTAMRPRKRRRKAKTKSRTGKRKTKRAKSGKPKPGTKAWMAYIRGKRGKKKS
jgi:hypothetical protein